MNPELQFFGDRLLSAATTGVYQGLLLTVVIGLGLRVLPGLNAATRHAVAMATLVLVAALPFLHLGKPTAGETPGLITEVPSIPREAAAAEEWEEPELTEHGLQWVFVPEEVEIADAEKAKSEFPSMAVFSSEENLARPEPGSVWEGEPERSAEISSTEGAAEETSIPEIAPGVEENRTLPVWARIPKHFELGLPSWAVLGVIGIWVVLGGMRLGKVGWQCRRLRELKRDGTAAPEHLQGLLERIRGEMKAGRPARLITSGEISAPMAAGFWRPAVLLPNHVVEEAKSLEMEQLLRHEVAHLRRRDDWANLLQQIIGAVFFFHPGVWWLSRRLTLEREIACDDYVLASTKSPQAYALLLTEFAGRMKAPDWVAAPAAWSRRSQLKERIGMILDQKRNSSTGLARTKAGVLAAAGAAIALWGWQSGPRLVFAGESSTASTTAVSGDTVSFSAEAESPARTKPARASSAVTIETGTTSGVSASSGVVTITDPAVKAIPGGRAIVAIAAEPARVTAPVEISVDIPKPRIAQIHAAPAPEAPKPPRAPREPREPGKESLEGRVARLERLIESLTGERKGEGVHFQDKGDFRWESKDQVKASKEHEKASKEHAKAWKEYEKGWKEHVKEAEKWPEFGPNEDQLARIHEQAEKMAQQAAREAERMAQEGHRMAMRFQFDGKFDSKREALEAQRRALEQEMQALESQMERLEGMIDRIETEQEEQGREKKRDSSDGSNPEPAPKF